MQSASEKWYIGQFSKLTGVSIRMLRHYDAIGLLKAEQLRNGYRIYNSQDLEKLEQILILKSFGFNLNQIKRFCDNKDNVKQFLEEKKADLLFQVEQCKHSIEVLTNILKKVEANDGIDIASTIKLVGAYKNINKS